MTLLVLASWALCVAAICLAGLAAAALWSRGSMPLLTLLRSALWWGLLLVLIALLALGIRVPLASAPAAAAMAVGLGVAGVLAFLALRTWPPRTIGPARRSPRLAWLLIATLGLAVLAWAFAALGPVTNYDSGLYHLGAIHYSADYAAIPGIANLYFPFGYGNSLFSLAAFLSNGPWGLEGFRLANGLVLALVALDLSLRVLQRRWSVGTYVLMVAVAFAFLPMLRLADYWVTSPSQDSSVLAVTVVSGAYLADAIARAGRRTRGWPSDAAVAIVTSVILVSMRPLMGVYAAVVILILAVLLLRRARVRWYAWAALAATAVAAVCVQAWRDRILSGWLLYPLDVLSFDVPWRAPAATLETAATLWSARDPGMAADWQTASGYAWVSAWIGRLPQQWETYLLAVLGVATVILLITSARVRRENRLMLLAMAAPALTVVVWFIATPPSFRFAWGPLLLLGAIPAGWSLHALGSRVTWRRALVAGTALMVLCGVGSFAVQAVHVGKTSEGARTSPRTWQLGPVTVDYMVSPVPVPVTEPITREGGVEFRYPQGTDQCWREFPLCTGSVPNSLRWRTPMVIQDGFAQ